MQSNLQETNKKICKHFINVVNFFCKFGKYSLHFKMLQYSMAAFWRPWDNNNSNERNEKKDDIESSKKDKRALSEEMQMAVLNVYQYLSQDGKFPRKITETSKALQLHRNTVERVIKRGFVQKSKRGDNFKTQVKLSLIDNHWKSLIRQTIYGFYREKTAPTIDTLYEKLIDISKDTDYEFPYKRTALYQLVKKLGFEYKQCDKRSVIMESMTIVAWRYKYLLEIEKYRSQGYLIVYLDETWFDSHDTVKKIWTDCTKESALSAPVSKGKRVVICHAGSVKGFVENALLLCGKDIAKSYVDYHQNMNGEVFESWFRDKLLPNLPKDRKVCIVLDNAKYHCRLIEKTPSMNMRKNDMIDFMKKYVIRIPKPFPTKPVLLSLIKEANIQKQYIVDNIAKLAGHSVLRLPPYHCMLNPIEMVWSQLKQHCRRDNIHTNEPAKVLELIRDVCNTKISLKNWENYVGHTIKVEQNFRKTDHIVDNEVEPVIVEYYSSSESDSNSDIEQ